MFLEYYQQMRMFDKSPSTIWKIQLAKRQLHEYLLDLTKIRQKKNNECVFDHTMKVIDLIDNKNEITLFAALLHDLGKWKHKPKVCHSQESAELAASILDEWKTPQQFIAPIVNIVSTHMVDITQFKSAGIRKFVSKVGCENIENWFSVRRADSLSYSSRSMSLIQRFYRQVQDEFVIRKPIPAMKSPNIERVVIGKDTVQANMLLSIKGSLDER